MAGAVVILALAVPVRALPAAPDSALTFDAEVCRFRIDDVTSAVEVYVAVQRSQLKFVQESDHWVAGFACEVEIVRGDSALIRHRWQAQHQARSSDEARPGQLLFTQQQFQVPVGEYKFAIRVEDLNRDVFSTRLLQLRVDPYPPGLCLSDLELASLIERDTSLTQFSKNNFKVIPNPGTLYGMGMPVVYSYSEIYNLTSPSDSSYTVLYRVLDGNSREVKVAPRKIHRIMGRSLVEVNALNIAALPSGSYSLEQRVMDQASGQVASNLRRFFVYREKDASATAVEAGVNFDALVAHYRTLSEKELDAEFETTRYIASDEERTIYAASNEDGKREFVVRFWSKRDQTPETAVNEFRESYLARVAFANRSFKGLRDGWKTDMGRVLLMYGYPSEIERVPSSGETRAYQAWKFYDLEGGADFEFVDIKGWGNYELVNSTARNELQDPDWERWLQVR